MINRDEHIKLSDCLITKHAYDRAKERLSWNKRVVDKMANRAYNFGLSHSHCKGELKKYVTGVWAKNRTANNIRIYGENLYVFGGITLITIYKIKTELTKYIKLSNTSKNPNKIKHL